MSRPNDPKDAFELILNAIDTGIYRPGDRLIWRFAHAHPRGAAAFGNPIDVSPRWTITNCILA
jgi:hypothetical protein